MPPTPLSLSKRSLLTITWPAYRQITYHSEYK
jgi:hypothetical protein